MPDNNLTTGQLPDAAAAYLAAVQERADIATAGTWQDYATALELLASALRSSADVPRLLGALEAVRKLHKGRVHEDYPDETPVCRECGEWCPCPTELAITAELLRTEVPADEH